MPRVTHTFSTSYPSEPESVGRARAAVAAFVVEAAAGSARIDDIRLAVSEAVCNAVLHAYAGGPGEIHVVAERVDDRLRVLIRDDGCGMQPRPACPGLGLGLVLIRQISDQVTVTQRPAGGTEIQMTFVLDPAAVDAQSAPRPQSAPHLLSAPQIPSAPHLPSAPAVTGDAPAPATAIAASPSDL